MPGYGSSSKLAAAANESLAAQQRAPSIEILAVRSHVKIRVLVFDVTSNDLRRRQFVLNTYRLKS